MRFWAVQRQQHRALSHPRPGRWQGCDPYRFGPAKMCCRASNHPDVQSKLCRRCKKRYRESENHPRACRFHPLNWSGGEKAKAIGFLRASDDVQDSLAAVHGTGMLRFWDCCGADTFDAPGCTFGRHVAYGEDDEDSGVFLVGR